MADRQKAILHQAFMWDCDVCGTENFARSMEVNSANVELESVELSSSFSGVVWVASPSVVQCKNCKAEFDAVHDDDEVDS